MSIYPATIRRDGDSFVVLFPDIPHAHTDGKSRGEALSHAPDALQAGIAMLMEKDMDIPTPGKPAGRKPVLAGPSRCDRVAKAQLYTALRSSGVRKAELARRVGIHKQQVERLMDIDHASRIEQLEAAFAALQMRLVVDNMLITKQGRPVARLIPERSGCASLIGSMKGRITIKGEILSTGVKWNAES